MGDKKLFFTHIAGLRGLAIILVLLFHLDGQVWAHGYLGVDVFLVITGYLLLRSRSEHPGTENLRDLMHFAHKRFTRIVPPMVIIILLALAAGLPILSPADEKFAFKAGLKACMGVVNIFYQKEFDDYFAADAAFIPLLHLWYLSVTLQVYLAYAVGAQILQRLPKRWAVGVAALVGIASLAYCYSYTLQEWVQALSFTGWGQQQAPSYYATLPRLWEVLAGGLILWLPSLSRRRIGATCAAGAGIAVILIAALCTRLPGVESMPLTLIVVLGTVLAVRYTPESHLALMLTNKSLVWLGRISFSVYLVHMPLIVYGHMWVYGQASPMVQAGIAAASVTLGWVFWWCIEKRRFPLWLALALWLGTLVACRLGRRADGFKDFFPVMEEPVYTQWRVFKDSSLTANWNPLLGPDNQVFILMNQPMPKPFPAPVLTLGSDQSRPTFILMGDSHACALYAGMDTACRKAGLSGIFLSSIVLPFHGWEVQRGSNYHFNPAKEQALLTWLKAHPELTHVIISQRWRQKFWFPRECSPEQYESDLRAFLLALRGVGKRVILMGPTPEFPLQSFLRYYRIRHLHGKSNDDFPSLTRQAHEQENARVYTILRRMEAEGLCSLVDPAEALAPGEVFLTVRDNMVQMRDDDHMFAGNAIWLMERLLPRLQRQLTDTPAQP